MEGSEKFSITDMYYAEIPQRSERSVRSNEKGGSTIILRRLVVWRGGGGGSGVRRGGCRSGECGGVVVVVVGVVVLNGRLLKIWKSNDGDTKGVKLG